MQNTQPEKFTASDLINAREKLEEKRKEMALLIFWGVMNNEKEDLTLDGEATHTLTQSDSEILNNVSVYGAVKQEALEAGFVVSSVVSNDGLVTLTIKIKEEDYG